MNADAPVATDCTICLLDAPEARAAADVFGDELWAGGLIRGFDVPGWVFLRLRRHAEGLGELTQAELTTFGRRLRDLMGAVSDVTGASVIYLLMFGEQNPHVHLLVAPRTDDVPLDRRNGSILQLRSERADVAGALALVDALRDAYRFRSQQAMDSDPSGPPAAPN